jgi:hypothetical protein
MPAPTIVTAVPDGKVWRVKLVTPEGASTLSLRLFRTRREALDLAAAISKETGWEVVP